MRGTSGATTSRSSLRRAPGRSDVNARDSIFSEYAIDVRTATLYNPVQLLAQRVVAAADTHRDVEDEWQERQVDLRRNRFDIQCDRLARGEVARHRAPRDGNIHISFRYSIDDPCRWIGLTVIGIDAV